MRTAYCFDFDGTVTSEELLPLIAKEVGLFDEINVLTEATIAGEITFEESFRYRCGLLSSIPISRVEEIVRTVGLNTEIVHFLQENSANTFIITGNLDVWVGPLLNDLGLNFFASSAENVGDSLMGVKSIINKGNAIQQLRFGFEKIVAIGDGMGDVEMFEKSDISVAFGGVHYPIESLIEESTHVIFSEAALCRFLSMQ